MTKVETAIVAKMIKSHPPTGQIVRHSKESFCVKHKNPYTSAVGCRECLANKKR